MENNQDLSKLYSMDMHEVIGITATSDTYATPTCGVLRVPSGWIYMFWDFEKQDYVREIFVPYTS
jgi:hypothetical protein